MVIRHLSTVCEAARLSPPAGAPRRRAAQSHQPVRGLLEALDELVDDVRHLPPGLRRRDRTLERCTAQRCSAGLRGAPQRCQVGRALLTCFSLGCVWNWEVVALMTARSSSCTHRFWPDSWEGVLAHRRPAPRRRRHRRCPGRGSAHHGLPAADLAAGQLELVPGHGQVVPGGLGCRLAAGELRHGWLSTRARLGATGSHSRKSTLPSPQKQALRLSATARAQQAGLSLEGL